MKITKHAVLVDFYINVCSCLCVLVYECVSVCAVKYASCRMQSKWQLKGT